MAACSIAAAADRNPRGSNMLTPGHLPLEHSFSEVASNALRLDMEPLGPSASPHGRAMEAGREMRRIVGDNFGRPALDWFDERSEKWRGSSIHGGAKFGAWFGLSVDPWGVQEAKVYYELRPGDLDGLPSNLRLAARTAVELLPVLVPIFTSIACVRQRGGQRLYFFHRGDLRLLDLDPLLNRLGIGHQLPSLPRLRRDPRRPFRVAGGLGNPPVCATPTGHRARSTCRLRCPRPAGADVDLIQMVLARPHTAELNRWTQAMTPDDERGRQHQRRQLSRAAAGTSAFRSTCTEWLHASRRATVAWRRAGDPTRDRPYTI
jgi:hypothetical protein